MPTYDYLCEKCKKGFELFQSMKDAPIAVCPADLCRQKTWGKGKVKRQLGTGAGLIFKGSGFYITDYRSEGYKEAAKKETSGSSTTETKSSETKPTETKAAESKPAETKKAESKPAAAEKAKSSAKKK